MTDEIVDSKMAADESSLPFRVLLPRTLGAMLLGGALSWIIATVWCYPLGRVLFPAIFPSGVMLKAAVQSTFLTALAGFLLGLALSCARGGVWTRAIATVLGVWIGATVFLVNALIAIVFIVFLCTQIPTSPTTTRLTPTDIRFGIWTTIPCLITGGAVLLSVFKMHVADTATWWHQWRADFVESTTAIFKPRAQHKLERFVLHSPLSPDECRARLPQIATVETSKFAFWEKLLSPDSKPLSVKIEGNHWIFSGKRSLFGVFSRIWTGHYSSAGLLFCVDLTPSEKSTQLNCVSRWMPLAKIWLLIFGGFYAFWCAGLLLMAVGGFAVTLIQKPSISSFFQGLFFAFGAFLMWGVSWLYFRGLFRNIVWRGRKQELMAIEALETVLEAQIIERETVRYKWGLFEEKSQNTPKND